MIQPEPYEIIKTVQEPIVTHHVAYSEVLPATESVQYAATGIGSHVVSHEELAGPLEAQYAGLQRIPTGNGPVLGAGFGGAVGGYGGAYGVGPTVTTGYGAPVYYR